jgi:hypothetical protein
VFLLEDFFFSPPDEMAGAEVLVFASRDFLAGAFCGRFDDRADVWIISDRVVEKADFRVGVFIGLPRKLATAKELGIGGRRRWWWRHLCPEGCLSEVFLALSALKGSNRIQRGIQIGLVSVIIAPVAILTNKSSCGEGFLRLP